MIYDKAQIIIIGKISSGNTMERPLGDVIFGIKTGELKRGDIGDISDNYKKDSKLEGNLFILSVHKYQCDKMSPIAYLQNVAARLVSNVAKYDHITPTLVKLHWLPVRLGSFSREQCLLISVSMAIRLSTLGD